MSIASTDFCFHLLVLLVAGLLAQPSLIAQPLSGTYTLGGANPNFGSFAGAINSLTANGVAGPVTFNVRSGYYYEQVSIPEISGASAINTITFQSETGDSTSVVLLHPTSPAAAGNYTLQLNGADHFIFRKLTFARTGGYAFSTVVELTNQANHNQFLNNRFEGTDQVSSPNLNGTRSGIFSEFDSNQNHNIFRRNHFKDNANGIHLHGKALGPKSVGNIIEENIFETYYFGVNLVYHDGPVIRNNRVARATAAAFPEFNGISIRYTVGALEVTGNQVIGRNGEVGIRLTTCNGNGTPGLIANNFVQVSGNGRGIFLEYGCNEQRIYHNSVNVTGSSATSSAFQVAPSAGTNFTNIELVNNNLVNAAGGYAIYVPYPLLSSLSVSDYNNLYTSGPTFAFYAGSLNTFAAWKATTPYDDHSVSVNPGFISQTDLHIGAAPLNGAALPLPAITLDFDGEPRNATSPDIGADEFTPPQPDASVTVPANFPTICAGSASSITASLVNSGNTPLTNVSVSLSYSGPLSGALTALVPGPVAPGQSAIALFPTMSLTATGTYQVAVWSALPGDVNNLNDTAHATLTVTALPNVLAFTDTAICKGQAALLAGTGADFYSWSPPLGLSAVTGTAVTASPTSTTTYTLTGTTSSGCTNTDEVTVTVHPVPLISISPTSAAICPGDSTSFTATGALTYTWSTGQANPTISVSPTVQTMFSVTGTSGQGCSGSSTAFVNVLPAPVFSLGNDTAIASGSTLTVTAQSGGVYLWNDSSTAQTFSVTQPGTYWVTVTNAAGCSATDSITVSFFNSSAADVAEILQLYPNPTNGFVRVAFPENVEGSGVTFQVSDLAGKQVIKAETGVSDRFADLNLNSLRAGVYVLQVSLPTGSVFRKIVKQ